LDWYFRGTEDDCSDPTADRRHHILSAVGGFALALLIGAGLLIVAALNG
jgi:hypothetical protein